MADPLTGTLLEVDVGPVAHGGHCVARVGGANGRVVFVRHAIPGERVRVLITEDGGGGFCRGDAVEVLRADADRTEPPCPYSGPRACGGCDWQHVAPARQRELKAAVVAQQLRRLAGLDRAVAVEPLPGGPLGWRSRISYAADDLGRLGLRRHRSHVIELVDRCQLGAPGVGDAGELAQSWPGAGGIEVTASGAERAVFRHPTGPRAAEQISGPPTFTRSVGTHAFTVSARGFWQGHPAAAATYTAAVAQALQPRPGDVALDLYGGAGLFAVHLAPAIGATGQVHLVEADRRAVVDATANLAPYPWADARRAAVSGAVVRSLGTVDVIVLDPPRTGAGRAVMEAVLASGARAVAYVACDPAAFARDVRTAVDAGWRLAHLRAFDAFPMTHHVECVGQLLPPE